LTEAELNTLFKSTVKLFLSYKSDANDAFEMLGDLTRESDINVFTFKDKKGHGMDWRLMRLWPESMTKRDVIDQILYKIRTKEDEHTNRSELNYLQIILKNAMKSRSVVLLFEASLRSSSVFFDVDRDKDIDDLTASDVKQVAIEHVGKALVTDQSKYSHLLKNVQMRMPRTDVQARVHDLFKDDQNLLMV